jgi:hypothetical protein
MEGRVAEDGGVANGMERTVQVTTTAGVEDKDIEFSHGPTRYFEAGVGPAVVRNGT